MSLIRQLYLIYNLNNICLLSLSLLKKNFYHCHVNVIHMCIIAFFIHFSTIACCPYLTCSSVCNYLLHSGLFLSVLNIIHVLDLESVCLIPKIYISITLTCSISYFVFICGFMER